MLTREEYSGIHGYDEYVKKELQREEERLKELKKELEKLQRSGHSRLWDRIWAMLAGFCTISGIVLLGFYLYTALVNHDGIALVVGIAGSVYVTCFSYGMWYNNYDCWPLGKIEKARGKEEAKLRLEREIAQSGKEIACLKQVLTA